MSRFKKPVFDWKIKSIGYRFVSYRFSLRENDSNDLKVLKIKIFRLNQCKAFGNYKNSEKNFIEIMKICSVYRNFGKFIVNREMFEKT